MTEWTSQIGYWDKKGILWASPLLSFSVTCAVVPSTVLAVLCPTVPEVWGLVPAPWLHHARSSSSAAWKWGQNICALHRVCCEGRDPEAKQQLAAWALLPRAGGLALKSLQSALGPHSQVFLNYLEIAAAVTSRTAIFSPTGLVYETDLNHTLILFQYPVPKRKIA